ncbi:phospholipase D-like domain-containing protein [Haladaptatus sp. F3-133]|jgi:hypothetical protein|uniref:Phospholipase D-like domain-containing protein n=1 Tax=Halorutilus salinus TaxID=2487751 RepID=A0A9Q4C779_9EURY|nr:phospholipase D-like domain-containing protein [Halorutilus salinus]MCX2819684.1 phospholipase D-like domain-containing protein [Halorutilus salinus]
MSRTEEEPGVRLLDTDSSDVRFKDALSELFAGDGTVYIVSGYFTYQGYRAIRDDIVSFLERSHENELVAVVSPASDQFSPRIAYDLWGMDDNDQVRLYKQPRGLHAKLYIRDGPEPTCILGSANITQIAFKYNTEINVQITRDTIDHPDVRQFRDWMVELVESSEPLRRRDLFAPFQVGGSVINWSNKARHLPRRNVALRAVPVIIILIFFSGMFSWLFSLI